MRAGHSCRRGGRYSSPSLLSPTRCLLELETAAAAVAARRSVLFCSVTSGERVASAAAPSPSARELPTRPTTEMSVSSAHRVAVGATARTLRNPSFVAERVVLFCFFEFAPLNER
jgi:hypothetical protein